MKIPRAHPSSFVAFVMALAALLSASRANGAGGEPKFLVTQIPIDAGRGQAAAGAGLPPGARIALVVPGQPPASAEILTKGFAAAGRASLSNDARRFLFVGRKSASDPLSIWEMELDGRRVRKIAGCDGDCTRAIYAASIFTIDAAAPAPLIVFSSRSDLFAMRADGSETRRITFNPYGAGDPVLLSDGRLVYSSRTSAEAGAATDLYSIHTDGTGVFPFVVARAGEAPARRRMASESAGGEVFFIESDGASPLGGGALVAVPRTRNSTGRRVIADSTRGGFHSPAALPDGRVLAAFLPGERGSYGIVRIDPSDPSRIDPMFDAPDRHDVDPVPLAPRTPPAGRSSAVRDGVSNGTLYCLDANRSGDALARHAGGSAAFVDVFRPAPSGAELLVDRIPVETDGSFLLRVPARTPLRLATVDAGGNVVRAMRNWIWVMPNESRGCIGCHEDRDLTPPNRMVEALRRAPREVGVTPAAAGKQP